MHLPSASFVPAYNSKFLDETIASVYAQTVQPGQVIVVNDGSTDDTEDRIGRLAAQLPDNFIWRTKENGGEASARNLGLRLATGTHVAFLDHDDLWHPEKLERQLAHFASNPDLALSFTAARYTFRDFQEVPGRTRLPGARQDDKWDSDPAVLIEEILLNRCPIATMSTVMMCRDAVRRVTPFDERLVILSDVLMYLELAIRGLKVDYLPEAFIEYRWHGSNSSRDVGFLWESLCLVHDRFLREHAAELPDNIRTRARKWRAHRHLQTAIDALLHGENRRARRHVFAAARARPLSVRPGWIRILGIGPPPSGPWPP